MRVVVTGAGGFLGWHLRVRLSALTGHDVVAIGRDNWADLDDAMADAAACIHVAGVNRGDDLAVERGNRDLALDVARALAGSDVRTVVYAGSTQETGDSPYARGKRAAAAILAEAATAEGAAFRHVRLPNLFGEHGRPGYNSFVATFIDGIIRGAALEVTDRPITLLHVQDAAQSLIDAIDGEVCVPTPRATTVVEVLDTLRSMHDGYSRNGDLPDLGDPFHRDLFNAYRAALFPRHYPIPLIAHADHRGQLVEAVRSHGGQGQTFYSTTAPGATRGNHYHLRKVERFVVVEGDAVIALRRVGFEEVIEFPVDGAHPAVVDMPTHWVHSITNVGTTPLTTLFWTDTLFDPAAPDTFWENVTPESVT